jgi:hypothetical protein
MENTNVISAAEALGAALSEAEAAVLNLIESAKQKEICLRIDDIDGLKAAVEQEEELIASFKKADALREEKSVALANAAGLNGESASLNDIIAAMGETPQAERLSALRENLKNALALLQMHNARVEHLLELKKEYADFMLGLLRDPERRSGYLQTGERDEGDDGRRILDIHV